jgi:hypothetical protein
MLCLWRSWGSQSWNSIQLSTGSLQAVCHFDCWAVAIRNLTRSKAVRMLPAIEPIHLLSEVQCFAESVIA